MKFPGIGLVVTYESERMMHDPNENQRDEAARAPERSSPDSAVAFINRRLEDLAEANALYGKDQRLSAPDKIARNDREISWLKDLRSMLSLDGAARAPERLRGGYLDAALAGSNMFSRTSERSHSIVIEFTSLEAMQIARDAIIKASGAR